MPKKQNFSRDKLDINYVPISILKPIDLNPRVWSKDAIGQLKESIRKFGMVDPLLVNSAPNRKNFVIGGNFRLSIAKEMGIAEVPVVYVNIPDPEREMELCVRLNKNVGAFDMDALADFGESFLKDIGFSSEELDSIFEIDELPEVFDLNKELAKLDIKKVEAKKGDVWLLGNHRLFIGDSMIEEDMLKLMDGQKADMCFTDPPYILDYLKGKKKKGEATTGFGYKRDRRYLETDVLPPDFTEKWIGNVAKVAKDDFSIIIYENWKNIRTIWGEMEKYWKIKNMIVWHLQNRTQGFAGRYKFFSKHDIAMVGTSEKQGGLNLKTEEELLQNEYETALYAISGHPQWESYEKGKKYCPTDFIEYKASDEKSSGQGIIFGTKPLEILIPYLKVLTKRDQLVLEPFGGSGSTLIACEKMKRKCFLMEKSPVYAEVIKARWQKLTGQKAKKL
ncbi:MAG: DNA methyltransferase [Candidatus Komeilibacteria bacterium]|nr:DNA methyltransferase [Candidatus Komeilibacteria bacterium]